MESKICNKCLEEKPLMEFHFVDKPKNVRRPDCKICRNKVRKDYCIENRDKILDTAKDYYKKNKEKVKAYQKDYRKSNKDKVLEMNRSYVSRKYKSDPLFRVSASLRCLVLQSFKKQGYTKKSRTHEILGCSFEELVVHLEDNLYNFKISDNDLDLDHIIPLSTAKSEEDVLKLNHYTNLQLLPSFYNRHIKSDKPFDKEHFEDWLKQQSLE